jgi:hypothetical protein
MEKLGTFPFGEPNRKVVQKDRTPKKAFVLGIYASAVHCIWKAADHHILVRAMAVASEPELFWTGNPYEAKEILRSIKVPEEAGYVRYPGRLLNGPVGRSLDIDILRPLNLPRKEIWLCYLVPYHLSNKGQRKALRKYQRFKQPYNLPDAEIYPTNKKQEFLNEERIEEIIKEIDESASEYIITLGDEPLLHFIRLFNPEILKLNGFKEYGQLYNIKIRDKEYRLLPLIHPKQAGKIGSHTERWLSKHNRWVNEKAKEISSLIRGVNQ